jgi:Ca2+-binding EF-hand superfamily protein
MINTKLATIAVIGVSLISGASIAGASMAGMSERMQWDMPEFNQIDLNNDETISPVEFEQFRQQRISEHKAEGRQMKNMNQTNMFDVIDLNQDGLVDAEEFSQHQANRRMTW